MIFLFFVIIPVILSNKLVRHGSSSILTDVSLLSFDGQEGVFAIFGHKMKSMLAMNVGDSLCW